jgi:hypothetical protein
MTECPNCEKPFHGRHCPQCNWEVPVVQASPRPAPRTWQVLTGPPLTKEQNAICAGIYKQVLAGTMRRQRGCSLITLWSESWGLPTEDLTDPPHLDDVRPRYDLSETDHQILEGARALRKIGVPVEAAFVQAEQAVRARMPS